jgi:hypothetical protein
MLAHVVHVHWSTAAFPRAYQVSMMSSLDAALLLLMVLASGLDCEGGASGMEGCRPAVPDIFCTAPRFDMITLYVVTCAQEACPASAWRSARQHRKGYHA